MTPCLTWGHWYKCHVLRTSQKNRINPTIRTKRRGVLRHNNPRRYIARANTSTTQDLKFETLRHPPYSFDLAPTSDYLVFGQLGKKCKVIVKRFRRSKDAFPLKLRIASFTTLLTPRRDFC